MIYDSIDLLGNSQVSNVTVDSGTSFPSIPSAGEIFFRSDEKQMYLYTGTEWIQVTGIAQGSVPKITSVAITDSSYNAVDDTAVGLDGGYIKITGSGFNAGAVVRIDQTLATSVAFISETELRVQVPGRSAGTYNLYVVNSDASVAIKVNGITYSAFPAWATGSSLTGMANESISIQLSAPAATSYTLAAGSTLPTGLTLTSGGLLSGTITGITESTVYTFSIIAVDAESQDTSRAFTLTVSVVLGDANFKDTVLLLKTAAVERGTNNSIIDSSVATNHVDRFGNAAPASFGPYGLTGWSNFFDGTGDFLTIASNAAFNQNAAFTVECWVYPTALINGYIYAQLRSGYLCLALYNSGKFVVDKSGVGVQITSTSTFSINSWYHLAMSFDGTTTRLFVNGVLEGSSSGGGAASGAELTIGNYLTGTNTFYGYISNLRIVNGTALYTSNFTPSTTTLTAVAGTSLLTCQSNRFIDNSTNNFTITRNGDAKISTFSPFKFKDNEYAIATAGGAAYFDGADDYLTVPSNAAFNLTNTDFTIEAWVYYSSSATQQTLINFAPHNTIGISINRTGVGDTQVFIGNGSSWISQPTINSNTANNNLRPNVWNHIALVRNGGTVTLYHNGISAGSTNSVPSGFNGGAYIGCSFTTGAFEFFNGYISNFRIVKGTAVYTSNFTPSTSPLTSISGTSVLTFQDNGLKDNSTNNFTLTPSGNLTPSAQSPFRTINQRGSVYFDGTGDSLQSATVPTLGTGDFTIEFWVYPTATTRQDWFDAYIASPASRFLIYYNGTTINVYGNPPLADIITGGAITLNRWMHIAVTRQSNSICLFINGTQSGSTYTTPQNFTGNVIYLGRDPAGTTFMTGYLSNVRVVTGTALYTSNFTPPTTLLTAVTGTQFLTCQNNGIRDNSGNNIAITRNGDATNASFSPFALSQETAYAGSVYFDGTGDYLQIPYSPVYGILNGDFTIEGWFYPTISTMTAGVLITSRQSPGNQYVPYLIWLVGLTVTIYMSTNGSSWNVMNGANGGTAIQNAWNHYALVRSGSSINFYLNGVRQTAAATSAATLSNPTGTTLKIGATTGESANFTGYISNVRIVRGTAIYSGATYSVPTSPLTAVQNTVLLVNGGSTQSIYDATGRNFVETIGNTATALTVKKYGDASIYFDGTGDSIKIGHTDDVTLGSGDFTLECWAYFNNITNAMALINKGWQSGSGTNFASYLIHMTNTGMLRFNASSNGTAWDISNERNIGQMTANTWVHVAVTRSGTTFRAFIDGVIIPTFTFTNSSALFTSAVQQLRIGSNNSGTTVLNGYLEDVRITKGVARYTDSFTPPSRAFPTKSN